MVLAVSDPAPDFAAASSLGAIDFYPWKGASWAAMFSVPFAFTPVCTTELAAIAEHHAGFDGRAVKVLVIGVDTVPAYLDWLVDIELMSGLQATFPLVADDDRRIARSYGMIRADDPNVLPVLPGRWMKRVADFAVRTLFLITPDNHIALTMSYPPHVGLDLDEVFRVLDQLQAGYAKAP